MLTKIYEQNPSERELRKVVDALEDGGIIIYPTDSVYAFGCSLRFCLLDRQPAGVLRRREYQSANPTGESWAADCSGLSEGHEKS